MTLLITAEEVSYTIDAYTCGVTSLAGQSRQELDLYTCTPTQKWFEPPFCVYLLDCPDRFHCSHWWNLFKPVH